MSLLHILKTAREIETSLGQLREAKGLADQYLNIASDHMNNSDSSEDMEAIEKQFLNKIILLKMS